MSDASNETVKLCERLEAAISLYFRLLETSIYEQVTDQKTPRLYSAGMFEDAGVDLTLLLAQSHLYRNAFVEVTYAGPPAEPSVDLEPNEVPPVGYRAVLAHGKPKAAATILLPVAATAIREAIGPLEDDLPFVNLPIFKGVRSAKDWGDIRASTQDMAELRAQINAKRREYLEIVDTLKRKVEGRRHLVMGSVGGERTGGVAMNKPTLFVGSSIEGLAPARAVAAELEHDVDVTIWNQGVFDASKYPTEALVKVADRMDMGAFIVSPDDKVVSRGKQQSSPRDNIVFELGLFLGKLGRERTVFIMPRDTDIRLPTDLLGMAPLTYNAARGDGNLQAALTTACDEIRKRLLGEGVSGVALGATDEATRSAGESRTGVSGSCSSDDSMLGGLEDEAASARESQEARILEARLRSRRVDLSKPLNIKVMDKSFGWPIGTTAQHIKAVLGKLGMRISAWSGNMVLAEHPEREN
ncbi:MAG: TIR domain-containing protein [Planctomycetota bacterium]|jgi:predicted nucleotide-binding protein